MRSNAIIQRVTGGKQLPDEILAQIIDRTDGVPLYVEELTKSIISSDLLEEASTGYRIASQVLSNAIPNTLQHALMARLDRLQSAKYIAQLAAVVGRRFSYGVLKSISGVEDETLRHELSELVRMELISRVSLVPREIYTFRHALIQDAAYQSLLKRTRREYHTKIAEVLINEFPERRDTEPETFAHHLTEGGDAEAALPYWIKASKNAQLRFAMKEAANHISRALDLLARQEPSVERDEVELELQTNYGSVLTITEGYASLQVDDAFNRARELSKRIPDKSKIFRITDGQLWRHVVLAEYYTALKYGDQLRDLQRSLPDPKYKLQMHRGIGMSSIYVSRFDDADEHLQALVDEYETLNPGDEATVNPEVGIIGYAYLARVRWILGYADQALAMTSRALDISERSENQISIQQATTMRAIVHQVRQEFDLCSEWSARGLEYAKQREDAYWGSLASLINAAARTNAEELESGINLVESRLASYTAMGNLLGITQFQALLARMYGDAGNPGEGLRVIDDALAHIAKSEETYYEPEIYRLKGVLTLEHDAGNEDAAEADLRRGIDIARRHGSRSWEVQAATNLAALWLKQGFPQEAHDLLSPVYNWFTEGLDTPPLVRAADEMRRIEAALQ